jgi:hypothetical protein
MASKTREHYVLNNSNVNIKKELETLDRNDFDRVNILVNQIMEDIKETMGIDYEMGLGLMQDYMVDLINPDLLDFDSSDS